MPLPSLLLRRPAPSAAPALPLSGDRPLAAIGLILSAMLVFSLLALTLAWLLFKRLSRGQEAGVGTFAAGTAQ